MNPTTYISEEIPKDRFLRLFSPFLVLEELIRSKGYNSFQEAYEHVEDIFPLPRKDITSPKKHFRKEQWMAITFSPRIDTTGEETIRVTSTLMADADVLEFTTAFEFRADGTLHSHSLILYKGYPSDIIATKNCTSYIKNTKSKQWKTDKGHLDHKGPCIDIDGNQKSPLQRKNTTNYISKASKKIFQISSKMDFKLAVNQIEYKDLDKYYFKYARSTDHNEGCTPEEAQTQRED